MYKIGISKTNKTVYTIKIIGTAPTTFSPNWYKLKVFIAIGICSNWSGKNPNTSDKIDNPLKNDGINNKINGIVTANAFECVFAEANIDKNKINRFPNNPVFFYNTCEQIHQKPFLHRVSFFVLAKNQYPPNSPFPFLKDKIFISFYYV